MSKTSRVTIIVVSTFIVMMIMSMITALEPVMIFLGDTKCDYLGFHYGNHNYVKGHWHYGWTHWLYISMGCCLFLIQIAKVVVIAEEKGKKNTE